jgi:hypothetical protein
MNFRLLTRASLATGNDNLCAREGIPLRDRATDTSCSSGHERYSVSKIEERFELVFGHNASSPREERLCGLGIPLLGRITTEWKIMSGPVR